MSHTTQNRDRFPSGEVVQAMITCPDRATMLAQAAYVGADADIAEAAVSALTAGTAVAVVVSGKLAAGKDTVADLTAARLPALGFEPAVIHQTSGPMRREYAQILEIIAASPNLRAASAAVAGEMQIPAPAALHMAEVLFEVTRDPETIPDPNDRTDLNRHILQYHADHGRRDTSPEYWTHQFFQAVYSSLADGKSALLTGCRYPNEIGPAQTLGLMTVRLVVSRAVQEDRLWGRDGLEPNPAALDDKNECALDDYIGFNLAVGNDDDVEPTVARTCEYVTAHAERLSA